MEKEKSYSHSEYNDFNRFSNLDSIEWKIINHLVNSQTEDAKLFWKLLVSAKPDAAFIKDDEISRKSASN